MEGGMRKLAALLGFAGLVAVSAAMAGTLTVTGQSGRGSALTADVDTTTDGDITLNVVAESSQDWYAFLNQILPNGKIGVGCKSDVYLPASEASFSCTISNAPAGHYRAEVHTKRGKGTFTIELVTP
jgi:hypothetical protein